MRVTEAVKPVTRRFGFLVVRISDKGVEIKTYRKKRWRMVHWSEVAKIAFRLTPPKKPGWTAKEWDNILKTMGVK